MSMMVRNLRRNRWGGTFWPACLIALLRVAAPAGATPPDLSDLEFLTGDAQIAPASGTQELPEIAAGAGGFLAVWTDHRSSLVPLGSFTSGPYFVPGLGTMMDIYAARLDGDGEVMGGGPIIIAQAIMNQTFPKVAWNGQNWLVVWSSQRGIACCSYIDVLATRVSPDGVVLDDPPIVVDAAQTLDGLYWPCVASDGANWAVAWRDLDQAAGIFTIDGARVSPDGVVLDPGGKRLRHDVTNSYPTWPDIAFAGDEYYLVWNENSDDVRGQRLTTALDKIGSAAKLNIYNPSSGLVPRVASDGTSFFVAWFEDRYYGFAQVYGTRVSHAGGILDPSGIAVTGSNDYCQFEPIVAWDGLNWFVAYNWNTDTQDIRLTRISPSGVVLDPDGVPVATGPHNQSGPGIASIPGGGVRVVWMDDIFPSSDTGDIYTASVSAQGGAGPATCASVGPPRQTQPFFASNGDGYLAVFRSAISGEARIMAQRLRADGTTLDAEPIVVADGPSYLYGPSVAWNGSVYLVVWSNSLQSQVYMRRLAPDGAFLDPAPLYLMPGDTPVAAAMGDVFLVVCTHAQDPHFRYPYAMRIRGSDGAHLDPAPVLIGSYFATVPSVAVLGGRWIAVWQENPTHDNPRANIVGNFVDASGAPGAPFAVTNFAIASAEAPCVVEGPEAAMIAWSDSRAGGTTNDDVFARRILADGTLLDPGGVQITSAANNQIVPAVAWDGQEYAFVWTDYRADDPNYQPVGDIYAARVSEANQVVDPLGFAIANASIPEMDGALAGANGRAALGGIIFRSERAFATYRIGLRILNPPPATGVGEPARTIAASITVQPNPAGQGSVLSFVLEKGGPTQVGIYDAAGRLIREILRGESPAGLQSLSWDGTDASGARVSPGLYLVRVRTLEEGRSAKILRH